jgi:4-hydroxybenzoate polyprenyltransferase
MAESEVMAARPGLWAYVRIARVDHWFKNLLVLPGTVIALMLTRAPVSETIVPLLVGMASVCLVASANYVINEWLDRDFDRHHPSKRLRPSVSGQIRGSYVAVEYALLVAVGLGLGAAVGRQFLVLAAALLLMGLVYNVRPVRTKDRVYLDVLSESVNNPLRFLLGWSVVEAHALPPSSVLLAYWMGGAFLMATKRFAEYRSIGDAEVAGRYRRSFRFYTEDKLLISTFFYAIASGFFLGVFLVKYRIEYLLSFPFFALLFAWYLSIGLRPHSPTQSPERLYRETAFVVYLCVLAVVVGVLSVVDIPWLHVFMDRVSY